MNHGRINRRRRGTAIVETKKGILLTSGSWHGAFMLPGGKARSDESRVSAAARELQEETGLVAHSTEFLFSHTGSINKRYRYRDHHKVCLIKAIGKASPGHEIKRIEYYQPGCDLRLSSDTKEILEKYYYLKNRNAPNMTPAPQKTTPSHTKGRIYLISDLHLTHKNIIRYTHRPFKTTQAMDKALIDNWNKTVTNKDTIYFLGDLVPFKKEVHDVLPWLKKLNGHIIRIQGSHDPHGFGDDYGKLNGQFFLVHDPSRHPKHGKCPIPSDWHGWIIHGHTHNNDMRHYPFINGQNKTINVSVELISYKPISLEKLISLDLDHIKRMETINSTPERS